MEANGADFPFSFIHISEVATPFSFFATFNQNNQPKYLTNITHLIITIIMIARDPTTTNSITIPFTMLE